MTWKFYEIQISMSIYKVLLERNHTHFMYYQPVLPSRDRVDRDRMTCKAKNIYYVVFYQKSLQTPGLMYYIKYIENIIDFFLLKKVF